jgi:hypothetical protein
LIPHHNPMSIEHNRERYSACLREIHDVEAIQYSGAKRPGEMPEHIFDFNDGTRLIVSRERFPDGKVWLHVSASFRPESKRWWQCKNARTDKDILRLFAWCVLLHAKISGSNAPLELAGQSKVKHVPHWFGSDPQAG